MARQTRLGLQRRRLRFAIEGSSTFLSFVVSVLAVSEHLGEGPVGFGLSLVLGGTVGTMIHVLWPRLTSGRVPTLDAPDSKLGVCRPGPHGVVPGEPTKLLLDVRKGDVVSGHLAEVDNYDFSWQIIDERNYIRLLTGKRPNYVRGENDVPASKVNWTVPHEGPWFLILSVPRKQLTRDVEIQLRKV